MQIIIVDDNSLVRKTIRELLEGDNDEIYEYSDGESVITELKAGKLNPDWILLDIKMSGMNGFETAEIISKINPCWRIGFVTNYDIPAYRKKAKALGVDLLLSKNNLFLLRGKLKTKTAL